MAVRATDRFSGDTRLVAAWQSDPCVCHGSQTPAKHPGCRHLHSRRAVLAGVLAWWCYAWGGMLAWSGVVLSLEACFGGVLSWWCETVGVCCHGMVLPGRVFGLVVHTRHGWALLKWPRTSRQQMATHVVRVQAKMKRTTRVLGTHVDGVRHPGGVSDPKRGSALGRSGLQTSCGWCSSTPCAIRLLPHQPLQPNPLHPNPLHPNPLATLAAQLIIRRQPLQAQG